MKSNLLKISYEHFNEYSNWLKEQNLSQHEMRAQLCRVNHFLVFLGTAFSGSDNVFTDSFRRDDALKDYKRYLRNDLKSPVNSMNANIDAVDRFFQFLGLKPTRVAPDAPEPIKPLSDEMIARVEDFAYGRLKPRERALILLLLYAGLTPEECAMLNLHDVKLSTLSGHITLANRGTEAQLAIDARCRIVIREYLEDRADRFPFPEASAFFIDDRGERLTAAAVDLVVRQVGRELGSEMTAKTIRQTFRYTDARSKNQALLAVELASGVV